MLLRHLGLFLQHVGKFLETLAAKGLYLQEKQL
jgi:hypothetical protein